MVHSLQTLNHTSTTQYQYNAMAIATTMEQQQSSNHSLRQGTEV